MYDVSEELITGETDDSPLAPLTEQERVQINVRRIPLPWLGTHVLYVEEYPYDEPFELRRRVLLSIEPADADGTLRVRQFTRKAEHRQSPDADGGRRGIDARAATCSSSATARSFAAARAARMCLEHGAREAALARLSRGHRRRAVLVPQAQADLAKDDLVEEIAGFPHVDLDEARLFSCGISWSAPKDKEAGRARARRASTCTIAAGARASARRMAASCSSSCTAATGRCRRVASRWC